MFAERKKPKTEGSKAPLLDNMASKLRRNQLNEYGGKGSDASGVREETGAAHLKEEAALAARLFPLQELQESVIM